MNNVVRSLTLIAALGASAVVFANEPDKSTAAAPAAATPAAQPTATTKEPTKAPPGYKVKVIDGETRFCRKDQPLGTRFPTEVCLTEAQYQEQERNRASMRNEITDKQKSYRSNN